MQHPYVILKEFLENFDFENISRRQIKHGKLPSMQGVKIILSCRDPEFVFYDGAEYKMSAFR